MKQPELDVAKMVGPVLINNFVEGPARKSTLETSVTQVKSVAQRFGSRIGHVNDPSAGTVRDRFVGHVASLMLVIGAAVTPVLTADAAPAPTTEAKYAPQGVVHVAGAGARGGVIGRYTRPSKLTPSPGG